MFGEKSGSGQADVKVSLVIDQFLAMLWETARSKLLRCILKFPYEQPGWHKELGKAKEIEVMNRKMNLT
jgi:hypothetical protein